MESSTGILSVDPTRARNVAIQQSLFTIGHKRKKTAVPTHLRRLSQCEHFLVSLLVSHWWWENIHSDTIKFVNNCPECTITAGVSRHNDPLLHPSYPFQIVGIDLMELPRPRPQNQKSNKYVVVLQDYLTTWPLVYSASDQNLASI